MLNKIIFDGQNYTLITSSGNSYPCTRWFEKKTGQYHVKVPKEGTEECGRTYIRESHFTNSDTYEFETKTEHRTGLASGGWRSKLTDEEKVELETYEKGIERLKELASKREIPKVDPNSEEGILKEIARLQAKLARKQNS